MTQAGCRRDEYAEGCIVNINEAWEELESLSTDLSLRRDINGQWYVSQPVEQGGDGMLRGLAGRGRTQHKAVNAHVSKLRAVKSPAYVAVNAGSKHRTHWRWNGKRWRQLPR